MSMVMSLLIGIRVYISTEDTWNDDKTCSLTIPLIIRKFRKRKGLLNLQNQSKFIVMMWQKPEAMELHCDGSNKRASWIKSKIIVGRRWIVVLGNIITSHWLLIHNYGPRSRSIDNIVHISLVELHISLKKNLCIYM